MTTTVAVRLPDEIDERLSRLSERTGRSKSQYVKDALLEHLDDIEDAAMAAEAYRDFRLSGEPSIPAAEVYRDLGL